MYSKSIICFTINRSINLFQKQTNFNGIKSILIDQNDWILSSFKVNFCFQFYIFKFIVKFFVSDIKDEINL